MTCFSLAETGLQGTWLSEVLCIRVCNLAGKNQTTAKPRHAVNVQHLRQCEPRRRILIGELGDLGPIPGSLPSAG